jgi:hypothetical protein
MSFDVAADAHDNFGESMGKEDLNVAVQVAFENAKNNAAVTGEKSTWMVEGTDGQVFVSVEIVDTV